METTNLAFPTPYDTFLLEHEEHLHQIYQDIQACKVENIRRTSIHDIENILSLFRGATPTKKREALIDFLRVMPEYKTTDQDVLYRRLKALKDRIKVTHGTSDLYYYAMKKYYPIQSSESEA